MYPHRPALALAFFLKSSRLSYDQPTMTKAQVRHQISERLAAITTGEFSRLGARAAHNLTLTAEYRQARTLMAFLSMPSEIDTAPLIRQAFQDGKIVLVPKVIWEGRRLIPLRLDSPDADLEKDRHGLLNPSRQVEFPVDRIDLIVVPGLAFDSHGNRLGRGAGFYDRFLAQPQRKAITCGLALEWQHLAHLPIDGHDVPLDMLATDLQVRRFPAKPSQ